MAITRRTALLTLPLPPLPPDPPPAAPTALAIADSAAAIDLCRKRSTAHAKSAIQEAVKSAVPQVPSFARGRPFVRGPARLVACLSARPKSARHACCRRPGWMTAMVVTCHLCVSRLPSISLSPSLPLLASASSNSCCRRERSTRSILLATRLAGAASADAKLACPITAGTAAPAD